MNTYQTPPPGERRGDMPRVRPDEELNIVEMEREGAHVILEDTGREYVVKVRVPGQRQIRKTSTSGYPVAGAFEAWQQLQGKDGEK